MVFYSFPFSHRDTALKQKKASYFFSNRKTKSPLFCFLRQPSCWLDYLWPLSSRSSTAHYHPVRGLGSVSLAILECDRWCPVSAAGPRAPYSHGFFICGSCRINVLFLPSQTGNMDQHFLSPLLICSCFCACVYVCAPECLIISYILNFPPTPSAPWKPHPLLPLLYPSSIPLPFFFLPCHGISSSSIRLTSNLCVFSLT